MRSIRVIVGDYEADQMTFTIRNLIVLTSLVAIIAAVFSRFGHELGFIMLFLALANVVIAIRFYVGFKTGEPELAWTVVSASAIFSLTAILVYKLWS